MKLHIMDEREVMKALRAGDESKAVAQVAKLIEVYRPNGPLPTTVIEAASISPAVGYGLSQSAKHAGLTAHWVLRFLLETSPSCAQEFSPHFENLNARLLIDKLMTGCPAHKLGVQEGPEHDAINAVYYLSAVSLLVGKKGAEDDYKDAFALVNIQSIQQVARFAQSVPKPEAFRAAAAAAQVLAPARIIRHDDEIQAFLGAAVQNLDRSLN